ncbi:hypothetical protein C345_04550 [Cryptococcus neoformans A2-102-5]|nr:hypothetical protein C346_04663 [Cryptococcus neoformans var. grubii D17-1]OXG94295.1 hypothetical protein C345_04550 [Cryptococcus neoformans var. grubii A2-102-5]
MLKLEKANEQLMARNAPLEDELARVKAAQTLDNATRGSMKKQRYPGGQLFDPLYQEEHVEELAVRKAEEDEAGRKLYWNASLGHLKKRKKNRDPHYENILAARLVPGSREQKTRR